MKASIIATILSCSSVALAGCPRVCKSPTATCENTTVIQPSCCFNSPGGQFLMAQFWDTDPASGPEDSWTIDGVFPDHCDGSYTTYCAANRQIQNATQILQSFGQTSLLDTMNTYWHDYMGDNNGFWSSSWNSHGTCINTIDPKCYKNYEPHEDVVDYFTRTVGLFETLPTYKFLAQAGIHPNTTKTYKKKDVMAALNKPRGVDAVIHCSSDNQLTGVYYIFHLVGNFATGNFSAAQPVGETTEPCGDTITYLPKVKKSRISASPTTTTAMPTETFNAKCRKGVN